MRSVLVAALLGCVSGAAADWTPTSAEWPGWRVESTENLYFGSKYSTYPLAQMFDGDPKTAWVFSGLISDEEYRGAAEMAGSHYAFTIEPKDSVELDGIRLMNGYNKSQQIFQRNNRITKLEIYERGEVYEGRPLKTVTLSDKMGWHDISLPRKKYDSLVFVVKNVAKGTDDDLAISEIQFVNRGKSIDWNLPQTYIFTMGSDCGCGTILEARNRSGRTIASVVDMGSAAFSPDARYLAGIEDKGRPRVWLVDVRAGRVVKRWNISQEQLQETLGWKDARTLGFVKDWETGEVEPVFKLDAK